MNTKFTKQQIQDQVNDQVQSIKEWIDLFNLQIKRLQTLDIMEGKSIKLYHGYKDGYVKHNDSPTPPEQILQIWIYREHERKNGKPAIDCYCIFSLNDEAWLNDFSCLGVSHKKTNDNIERISWKEAYDLFEEIIKLNQKFPPVPVLRELQSN